MTYESLFRCLDVLAYAVCLAASTSALFLVWVLIGRIIEITGG
jgi:hypothetical protein